MIRHLAGPLAVLAVAVAGTVAYGGTTPVMLAVWTLFGLSTTLALAQVEADRQGARYLPLCPIQAPSRAPRIVHLHTTLT